MFVQPLYLFVLSYLKFSLSFLGWLIHDPSFPSIYSLFTFWALRSLIVFQITLHSADCWIIPFCFVTAIRASCISKSMMVYILPSFKSFCSHHITPSTFSLHHILSMNMTNNPHSKGIAHNSTTCHVVKVTVIILHLNDFFKAWSPCPDLSPMRLLPECCCRWKVSTL